VICLLLLPLLVLAHLVGDFVLQSNEMVRHKHEPGQSLRALTLHCAIHFLLICIFVIPYCVVQQNWPALSIALVIPLLHGLVDWGKVSFENRMKNHWGGPFLWMNRLMKVTNSTTVYQLSRTAKLFLFALDQSLHILIILFMGALFEYPAWVATSTYLSQIVQGQSVLLSPAERILTVCIVGLCTTVVSGMIVQIATEPAPQKGSYLTDEKITVITVQGGEEQRKTETSFSQEPAQEVQRGRIIGYLERCIIVLAVWMGSYTAVAFIVAAKSLARFKKLDNQEWAEYFLVGTLCSILCGTLSGFILRWLLTPLHLG
jgi:Protein of unknown function (DUF3307)